MSFTIEMGRLGGGGGGGGESSGNFLTCTKSPDIAFDIRRTQFVILGILCKG